MGLTDFLNPIDLVIDTLGGMISVGQSGYNLYKDVNNVDVERQKEAALELMSQQDLYNKQNVEKQFENTSALMDKGQDFYQKNMRLQHSLNDESMQKQFNMNAYLSNAARSIMQQRQAGVNPSSTTAGSAVTALGTQGGSSAVPSLGLPTSGSPAMVGSRYNPSQISTTQALLNIRRAQREESESENVDIRNLTQLQRDLVELQVARSNYVKNMSQAKNWDADTDKTLKTMDVYKRFLEEQINELKNRQEYQLRLGSAAEKNAATAAAEQEEQVRHNKQMEAIQRVQNSIAQQGINIEAAKLESIITKLAAETDLLDDAHRKNLLEQPNWVKAQLAKIGLDEALKKKAEIEAEKVGLDVDTYYFRLGQDVLEKIFGAASEFGEFEDSEYRVTQKNGDSTYDTHTRTRKRKMPNIKKVTRL